MVGIPIVPHFPKKHSNHNKIKSIPAQISDHLLEKLQYVIKPIFDVPSYNPRQINCIEVREVQEIFNRQVLI